MASNATPVPLLEPLVTLMETCGAALRSTPLPPRSVSECESDCDSASMCSEGMGDGTFLLVECKSAKRKRKLAVILPPANPTHRVLTHGNNGNQLTQSPSKSVSSFQDSADCNY